ncbi:MAG: helix-turn-helix domain-containing protein [Chromatiaceae bacterium]|nr:helix-turn-helix domain-containing protein [Chromatiaceae bacterium]
MLTKEGSLEIKILHRQGLSIREIARRLGISATLRSFGPIRTGLFAATAEGGKLDPPTGLHSRAVGGALRLDSATVIEREITTRGYRAASAHCAISG